MNQKFIVVDFETTGANAREDRIIQIGAILIENGVVTHSYNSFVNPHCPIPSFIQNLTGITDDMVADAPDIEDVLPDLLPMLDGAIFVAHNVTFDFAFLQHALQSNGYHTFSGYIIDTIELARMVTPHANSYQLTLLASQFDIENERPHQADSDARVTAQLFLELLERLNELPLVLVQRLLQFSNRYVSDIQVLLHDAEQRLLLQTSISDEQYDIFRHYALQQRRYAASDEEDDVEWSVDDLLKENNLGANWKDFEIRPAQETMMLAVKKSFENEEHLLVEAGTGTGKSLAYLLPAIEWAKKNDTPIVVSTHTINLQQQLFERDIPLLKSLLPQPFEAAILKGRSNYLCLRKFEQRTSQSEEVQTADEAVSLAQMLVWVSQTSTGDAEELNLNPKGKEVWKGVASHADSCLNRACPWFSRCFYHRARNKAQHADIIITNHSLLFTDMKADHRILPSYDYVIIDEAHQFEEVASKHLGHELSYGQLLSTLNRLQKDAYYGQVTKLSRSLSELDDDKLLNISELLQTAVPKVFELKRESEELFHSLYGLVGQQTSEADQNRQVFRLRKQQVSKQSWIEWLRARDRWAEQCTDLGKVLAEAVRKLQDFDLPLEVKGILTDVSGLSSEINGYPQLLSFLTNAREEDHVFWIETERTRNYLGIYLYGVPIEVGPQLKQGFFDHKVSAIMTSATLTVNKSFSYITKRVGLQDSDKTISVSLPSPFNYQDQAMVYVPSDFPNIKDVKESEFVKSLALSLTDAAIATKGRMLVLFTSFYMLKQVYEMMDELLKPYGIEVIGHGIESSSRTKLTTMFKNAEKAVLLGTNSFWEGVDIPGEDLSCLAIVRLPFWPPNHPVLEARTEKLEREGKNAFMELSVPQAVVRFKQGFGRLIRSKKDRGIVLVYDRRIIDARYGRVFLSSLPDVRVEKKPTSHIQETLHAWFSN